MNSNQGKNKSEESKKRLIAMVEVPEENLKNRDFKGLAQALYEMATAGAPVKPTPKQELAEWSPEDEKRYGMFKEALSGMISNADRTMIDNSRRRGISDDNIRKTIEDWM